MEYRVCQDVSFEKFRFWCRGGGMAAACFNWPFEEESEVCGEWRTSTEDAYASFYTVLDRVTDCDAPGNSCVRATPMGEPRLRRSESGAMKLTGADEKSVGDSILGVFASLWESLGKIVSFG